MENTEFEELYNGAKLKRIAGKQGEAIVACDAAIKRLRAENPHGFTGIKHRARQVALLLELRAFCNMQLDRIRPAESDAQEAMTEAQTSQDRLVFVHAFTTHIRILVRQGRFYGCDRQLQNHEKQLRSWDDPEGYRLRGAVLSLIGVIRFHQKAYGAAFTCFTEAEQIFGQPQYHDPVRRLRNARRYAFALAYAGKDKDALMQCHWVMEFTADLPTGEHPDSAWLVERIRHAIGSFWPTKWLLRSYKQEAGF